MYNKLFLTRLVTQLPFVRSLGFSSKIFHTIFHQIIYNVQVEKSGVKLNLLVAGVHYFLSRKGPDKHRDMFVSFIGAQEDG